MIGFRPLIKAPNLIGCCHFNGYLTSVTLNDCFPCNNYISYSKISQTESVFIVLYNIYVIIFVGDNMKRRYVERLKISVSEIGFGGWQLGSTGDIWEKMSEEEGINLVHEAIKQGVTFFDTAPGYGNGNSERIPGKALKGFRDEVYINTKIGHGPNGEYEFSVEGIQKSIKRSLNKLNTTYLDSAILHNPEMSILKGESDLIKELNNQKRLGFIKGYGVSIDTLEELELVLENIDVDVIEIMFNIIHQEPRYLFDKIKEKGILLIVKIPFDSGWLTGRFDKNTVFTGIRSRWTKDIKDTRSEIVMKIKEEIKSENLVNDALGYILSYDTVSTIIPGTRTIEHLKASVQASEHDFSTNKKLQLEKLYETYIKDKGTPW